MRTLTLTTLVLLTGLWVQAGQDREPPQRPGLVHCANLVYGKDQTSRCFADQFLSEAQKESHIWTSPKFHATRMESQDLFDYPFAVMSGEGRFTLTEDQVENLRQYILAGGFLVASAGCSSEEWAGSFVREIRRVMPESELQGLSMEHPVFHTVYDIEEIRTKKQGHQASLQALFVEGRVGVVFSREGLNDTASAGGNCCCCGSNEILNARQINVNLLAYALTH